NVKVHTLRGWSPEAGNAPLGAVIDKRAAPEPSCPPAAQAKKTIGFADAKSASVSAPAKEKAYLLQVRTNQYW
ncbi:MAG: hypothetical protein II889_13625, partial [Clostridia bacterium]|nr:hypothetical protein [Clostridia bacterium]